MQSEFQDSRRKTNNKTKNTNTTTTQKREGGNKIKGKRKTAMHGKLVHQHRLSYAQVESGDTESPSSSLLAALKGSPHPSRMEAPSTSSQGTETFLFTPG